MSGFLIFLAVIILILMAAIPVILLVMTGGMKSQIMQMQRELRQIAKILENNPPQSQVPPIEEPVKVEPMLSIEKEVGITHTIETASEETFEEQPEEKQPETHVEEVQPVFVPIEESKPVEETSPIMAEPMVEPIQAEEPKKTEPVRPPQKSFNFEKFIGENLINKIGIAVLVIGIGLFVKYAIDNNWINEVGRVVIGFLSGGILLALAYKFHKSYRAFSSVLAGGAITVFYFTVAIAFREYELFGQVVSFVLMVLITAFSVCLSIIYDRRELAILSMIGGFLTPFMVSTGSGNYHVLFTYIAILNVGMLALSMSKQWKELLIIGFVGTQLIFWMYYIGNRYEENDAQNLALLVYASVFYLIFLMMPLIQVFRAKEPNQDYFLNDSLLSVNSFLYLLAGILLMNRIGAENIKGLLSGLLAAINGVVALAVYRKKKGENLCHLFTGLSICFLALTAPLQLDGNYITLFWATETILLLWLFSKSNRAIFYYGSLLLLFCTFISLMIDHTNQSDWSDYDSGTIFLNQFFITRLYVSLSILVGGILLRRYCVAHPVRTWALPGWLPTAFNVVSVCLFYYTGYKEIGEYTDYVTDSYWHMAYTALFLFVVALITGRHPETCRFKVYALLTLWAFGCIYYWFFAEDSQWVRYTLAQDHEFNATYVLLYWIGFAALGGLFAITAKCFYKRNPFKSGFGKTFTWFFNVISVICLSIGLLELFAQIGIFGDISVDRYNKAGITILWTMCAFVQMWLGMRLRYKTLRIISLILLALVLVKLFLFDLSHVSQGAKIIAFVVLGIVLLVLSFLYQKLKKILFEDDDSPVAGPTTNEDEQ